jgi:hypothetical protein
VETPVHMRRSLAAREVRRAKVREALEADGSVRRAGIVIVLSVYERPYSLGNIRFLKRSELG